MYPSPTWKTLVRKIDTKSKKKSNPNFVELENLFSILFLSRVDPVIFLQVQEAKSRDDIHKCHLNILRNSVFVHYSSLLE